jgi:alkylglycerol monooxygenase
MEEYGKVLLIAMPLFLVLIILEKMYGYYKKVDYAPYMDSVASISSGMTNVTKSVLGLSVAIISYSWMVEHLAIYTLKSSFLVYAVAFIVIDFQGYWVHRWSHKINLFWNRHVIHHSSEEFNLSCALRQSISSIFGLFTFLLLPAALLGIPSRVIAVLLPIQLFLQFWYHTRYIGKLGFLENILVTPSHHRVHHAINKEYIDKNLSQIFIFWDKWFGTFQEELKEVPPVYGISRPARTWNPFKINFQHLWLLIQDAWRAENWNDKLKIWFMPTGWRPDGFEEKYPIAKIENAYDFQKFGTQNSTALTNWAIVQMLVTLLLMSYFFGNIGNVGLLGIYLYGIFIFVSIFSYTELMDKNRYAWIFETIRFSFGALLIYQFGNWFGIDELIPFGTQIVTFFFILSLLGSFYFTQVEFKNNASFQAIRDKYT